MKITVELTDDQMNQLAEAIANAVAKKQLRADSPVVTLEEAAIFAGCPSVGAFRKWAKRYGVKSCAQGRYARQTLRGALNREARLINGAKSGQHLKKISR